MVLGCLTATKTSRPFENDLDLTNAFLGLVFESEMRSSCNETVAACEKSLYSRHNKSNLWRFI